jgi:hypothetical protein
MPSEPIQEAINGLLSEASAATARRVSLGAMTVVLIMSSLIACSAPAPTVKVIPTVDLDATVRIRVEETAEAVSVFETAVANSIMMTQEAERTSEPEPTPEPTATQTPTPTESPLPTATSTASPSPQPEPTATLMPEATTPAGISNQDAIDIVRSYLSTKSYKHNFSQQNCLSALEISSHRWEAEDEEDAWVVSIILNQPWFGASTLAWKYNTRISLVTPLTQVMYWPDPFQPVQQVTYC